MKYMINKKYGLTIQSFEGQLQQHNYVIKQGTHCLHPPTCVLYYQDSCEYYHDDYEIVKSIDLQWFKKIGCKLCINCIIDSLACSGEFTNFRFFENELDKTNNYNLPNYPLNPSEIIKSKKPVNLAYDIFETLLKQNNHLVINEIIKKCDHYNKIYIIYIKNKINLVWIKYELCKNCINPNKETIENFEYKLFSIYDGECNLYL